MNFDNRVEGVESVLANLNDCIKNIELTTTGQLLACAAIIIHEAQTLVPVEFGVLKKSSYFRMAQDGQKAAEFGFTADYAIYVHENTTAHHNNGQALFLEDAILAKEDQCMDILTNAAMQGKQK